jgi:carbon storage regulator
MAMLVLTRKRHEMIRIGEDIVIRVIRTGPGSVKIGVEAPPEIRVIRGELVAPTNQLESTFEDSHADALLLHH